MNQDPGEAHQTSKTHKQQIPRHRENDIGATYMKNSRGTKENDLRASQLQIESGLNEVNYTTLDCTPSH